MDLASQGVDLFRQHRVLVDQLLDQVDAHLGELLAAERVLGDRLAVLGVGLRERLVAVGLSRLCEQDQRCCARCLEAERQVEQDERIEVEPDDVGRVATLRVSLSRTTQLREQKFPATRHLVRLAQPQAVLAHPANLHRRAGQLEPHLRRGPANRAPPPFAGAVEPETKVIVRRSSRVSVRRV